MASKELLLTHGKPLDSDKKRIECVHCHKVVPGFNRLQQHIGGVGKDAVECFKAPPDIKEMFKARLIQCKINKLFREVGDFQQQPLLPSKRTSSRSKEKYLDKTKIVRSREKKVALTPLPPPQKRGRKRALSCSSSPRGDQLASSPVKSLEKSSPRREENPGFGALVIRSPNPEVIISESRVDVLERVVTEKATISKSSALLSPCDNLASPEVSSLEKSSPRRENPSFGALTISLAGSRVERQNTKEDDSSGALRTTSPNFEPKSKSSKSLSTNQSSRGDESPNSCALNNIERKRCIGRFFFQNGIDFSTTESPSFQSVLKVGFSNEDAPLANAAMIIPTVQDLKSWILHDELLHIKSYVKELKNFWKTTSCSILLDVWTENTSHRTLMNALIACPMGTVYLDSADITIESQDTDAMELVLKGLIREAGGVQNVMQIVCDAPLKHINSATARLNQNSYNALYCTVSLAGCLENILEAISELDLVKNVLDTAKTLMKFIHTGNSSKFATTSSSQQKTRPAKFAGIWKTNNTFKAARPFYTLLNLSKNSKHVKEHWLEFGVSCIESYDSFWDNIPTVLRGVIPVIRALYKAKRDQEGARIADIFSLSRKIKEEIIRSLQYDAQLYEPFCSTVDKIWVSDLQRSMHIVAHFLHPKNRYCDKFRDDELVQLGLRKSLEYMVSQGKKQQIIQEMSSYRYDGWRVGCDEVDQDLHGLTPVEWWCQNGGEWPHLQNLAVRVLSQTCRSASSYGLKRSFAEKYLLSQRMNTSEQQFLKDLTFVHYNLYLQQSKPESVAESECNEIDPLDF